MRWYLILLLTCNSISPSIPCFSCKDISQQRPQNIDLLKQRVRHYYQDGLYEKDIACIATEVTEYLLTQLPSTPKKAIVFDIDETLLSNYHSFAQNDFSFNTSISRNFHEKAIIPMRNLYNFAKSADFSIFLITGRREAMRQETRNNLYEAGYSGWKQLFLRPNNDPLSSVKQYKTDSRKEIEQQGYTIIANIGDQKSDLRGGYALKTFKVPNPMYLIP